MEASAIVVDGSENILVKKAAGFLAGDIEMVTGKKPQVLESASTYPETMVIIGTIGNSKLIDALVNQKKLDVSRIKDKWENFIIQTVEKPFPGVRQALVIVGSDRRGAAYGTFTLSESIGVSPWYWWADVPVNKNAQLYVDATRFVSEGPAVKYRGIFINDESPAFRYWAVEKFGGINHKCYEKIFELLLRLKANFIWPSMWLPTMFNVDDPLNPKTADEFGIVVSTSHHEPMMRAHNEWSLFNGGAWDYNKNKEKLREFWRGGVERMGDYESVVTVGMRGDGDEGMSEETAVDLLKEVIKDQREIIADVTGKPAAETPQVWAIYKEVQDYYDKGMRVDDDIIVLFSDDNWGNIRYLPKNDAQSKKAKYGMYYHFDYVGAPVSYRWQNVTQTERVWEQMKLTYEHGVKDLWIANVGDIKPMEFPISFFMDFAWNPDAVKAGDLPGYYKKWARQQFGERYTDEIAEILSLYTKYNARRTPEMLKPETYSVENFREADRVAGEYNEIAEKSREIYNAIDDKYKPAFAQLVLLPVEMYANITEMYIAAGKNRHYGVHGAAAANHYAEKTKELFEKDVELTEKYHSINNGKWNHMMSQTHIGYTYWNHPPLNMMPAVSYVQARQPAELGYLLEYGKTPQWGWLDVEADFSFSTAFTEFNKVNNQEYYIDIINRGQEELSYSVRAEDNWIKLSKTTGTTLYHEKVYVSVDWDKAPKGQSTGHIIISGTGKEYIVDVPVNNTVIEAKGFVEGQGVVSIEANHYTNKTDGKDARWVVVPNLGRTGSSVIIEPVTTQIDKIGKGTPRLDYEFTWLNTPDDNTVTIEAFFSPTQDFLKKGGLKFAIAIDDEEPQVINLNKGEEQPDWKYAEWWSRSVGDHIKKTTSKHELTKGGVHTLKVWAIDAGVVFQKFVIYNGRQKYTYLGPPESRFINPSK